MGVFVLYVDEICLGASQFR